MGDSVPLMDNIVFTKYESGMVDSWSWHLTVQALDAARYVARLQRLVDLPFLDSGEADAEAEEYGSDGGFFELNGFATGAEFVEFVISSFAAADTELCKIEWQEIVKNIRKFSSGLAGEVEDVLVENYEMRFSGED